ncbi:MAG: S8 family serine peptidase [Gammaproteobacteria bacterium]|jgi:subtilisin family serine protease
MHARTILAFVFLLLTGVLAATRLPAAPTPQNPAIAAQPPPFAPDRVLVKFLPGTAVSEAGKIHRQSGGKLLEVIPGIGVHVVEVPKGKVRQKIALYAANPNVVYAEPDYYRVLVIPDEGDDPPLFGGPDRDYFVEQWGLHNTGQALTDPNSLYGGPIYGQPDADIDAPEGWDITTGDPAVKIAILDTGIDCNSIEHSGRCVEEISFVTEYSDNLDDIAQHGTHTAGIAAVNTNNGIGVAGVGWNSSVGNLKTCFEYEYDLYPPLGFYVITGVCPVSASAAAITYAADHGYHVINMSYGSDLVDENGEPAGIPVQPNTETDAVVYAWNHGVVLVAAAGNGGSEDPPDPTRLVYPAANDEVIAVAATDRFDNLASFSTFGSSWVSMMAPGDNILSTVPVEVCEFYADLTGEPFDPATEGCLTWNSGTSMASPHVAGAAALVWAHVFPGQSPQTCVSPSGIPCNVVVRRHLEYGADAVGASEQNFLAWSQHGRLNLYNTLSMVDTDVDGSPDSIDSDDDNDGLSDDFESSIGTDPLLADTDDDGLSDAAEVGWDGDPGSYDPATDTNPLSADTDGDGFADGMEAASLHDPLNAADAPVRGDINDDGVVNAADVLLGTRAILKLDTLTGDQLARADIGPLVSGTPSPDGLFTAGDLQLIQQIALQQLDLQN